MQNFRYLLLLSLASSYMFAGESSSSGIQKQKAKWIRYDGRWKKYMTKEDLQSRLHHIDMKNANTSYYAEAIIKEIVACQNEKPYVLANVIRCRDKNHRYDLKRYVTFMGVGCAISRQLKKERGAIFRALLSDRPEVLQALSRIGYYHPIELDAKVVIYE